MGRPTGSDWLQTFTGQKVYPLHLRPKDIRIEDIAHALAAQCRFAGHTKSHYSVAQHSYLVAANCKPADALWGLLHDASEAYLTDIPRPLKRRREFAWYRKAEDRAMAAICQAFELQLEQPEAVSVADKRMLATESRDVMAPLHPDWHVAAEPYPQRIAQLTPAQAESWFLSEFRRLQQAHLSRRSDVLASLLALVDVDVPRVKILGWTRQQRERAFAWAGAAHLSASDNPVRVPPKPKFLKAFPRIDDAAIAEALAA
jgi:hypothetical protein